MIRATRRVIRKGDGIVFLHDGEGDWGRFPPPEALSDDPDTPDIPPYAHSGHQHAEETEHKTPGVGHVLEGKWTKGPHGGAMFVMELATFEGNALDIDQWHPDNFSFIA